MEKSRIEKLNEAIVSEGMMSPTEVAEFLGFCRDTIYEMMSDGELPWTKIRGSRRIPRKLVVELAAKNMIVRDISLLEHSLGQGNQRAREYLRTVQN